MKKPRLYHKLGYRLCIALACVIVIILAAGISAILAHNHHGDQPKRQTPILDQKRPDKAAAPLTQRQADIIAKSLSSGSETSVRSVIAISSSQPLDPGVVGQLASLGDIKFDATTFRDNHDGTATVQARVTNPAPNTSSDWVVQLLNVDGEWKISSTDTQ